MSIGRKPFGRGGDKRIGRVPDGDNNCVDIQCEFAAWNGDWGASTGLVRFAEFIPDAFQSDDVSFGVPQDPFGVLEQEKFDALFLRMMDFLSPCGHLGERTTIDEIDFFRSEAESHSTCIHRDIAAAQDRDPLAVPERRIGVPLVVGLHEIRACQVLVGAEDTDEVLSFDVHELRQPSAGADEHRVEPVLEEIGDLKRSADADVCLDFHAKLFESVDFALYNRLWEPKFGDAVYQDATAFVERLEHRDVITVFGALCGAGDRSGTGADHRDALAAPCGRSGRRADDAVRRGEIGAEAFDASDRDGFLDVLEDLAHRAEPLALLLLRADASAHRGQQRSLPDDLERAGKIACRGLFEESGDVDRDRAATHAGLGRTLQTSARLAFRLFGGIAERDFVHVAGTDHGVLFGHRLRRNRHFLFCSHRITLLFAFRGLEHVADVFLRPDLLGLEGVHALQHLIPIDLMPVELGSVDANELGFAPYGDSATPAHSRAVDHDSIERDRRCYAEWFGRLGAELHHYGWSDCDHFVHRAAFAELFQRFGDESLAPARAVVRHEDQLVTCDRSHFLLHHEKLLRARPHDDGDVVAGFLMGLGNRVHWRYADAAPDADYMAAGAVDMRGLPEGAEHGRQDIAGLMAGEFHGRGAHGLENKGDGSAVGIGICNGQRDAFAELFVDHHDDKLSGLAVAGDECSFDLHAEDIFRKPRFSDDSVHVFVECVFVGRLRRKRHRG